MKRHPNPTHETLRGEFETVVARHNELFQEHPAFTIAVLFHEIDELLDKHTVDIEVAAEAAGVIGLNLGDREAGALLGAARDPDRVSAYMDEAGTDLVMADDRKRRLYHFQRGEEVDRP